jgi:hypothetical protein
VFAAIIHYFILYPSYFTLSPATRTAPKPPAVDPVAIGAFGVIFMTGPPLRAIYLPSSNNCVTDCTTRLPFFGGAFLLELRTGQS